EQGDLRTLSPESSQHLLHRRVGDAPLYIQIKEVLPRRRAVGAALELCQVQACGGERRQRMRQRTGTVRQPESQGGLGGPIAREGHRLASDEQKAGLVVRLVLDAL